MDQRIAGNDTGRTKDPDVTTAVVLHDYAGGITL